MNDNEALGDQWVDLISVAEFVADQMIEAAKTDTARAAFFLDAVRAVQSTIRAAQKVSHIMGWADEPAY